MWSGPLAATMLRVPPDCGFWLLADCVGLVEPLLLEGELEHAARPAVAMATAASAATRFEALGMGLFLLVFSAFVWAGLPAATSPLAITAYRKILRYPSRNPDQNQVRGSIVMKTVLIWHTR